MNSKVLLAAAILLGIGVGAYIYMYETEKDSSLWGKETPTEIEEEIRGGTIEEASDGRSQYVHESRNFSFLFGGDLSITSIPDLGGENLLIKDEEGNEFQIYVADYDEEGSMTPERIWQDLPNMVIDEPQYVLVGERKDTEALIFLSESEEFGETREVWFVANGQLFQVIAKRGNDAFIGPILETLVFQ